MLRRYVIYIIVGAKERFGFECYKCKTIACNKFSETELLFFTGHVEIALFKLEVVIHGHQH